MSAYQSALDFDESMGAPKEEKEKRAATQPSKMARRGCEFCPLNKVKGIQKVKGLERITGKKIMVWAQNPGYEENKKGLELVGPAGKLLWAEGEKVGLEREKCDIQNCVRCWTVDADEELGQMTPREPSKEEIHCCSVYTEEAIERNAGKAKVHLILGKVAAKTLLKGEYRKDQKTFFSQRLRAWCILTFHPSYFLRGGPASKKKEFREALAIAVTKAGEGRGKFSYVEARDYKAVMAKNLEEELRAPITKASAAGERIIVDIEDGWENEKNLIICYGFSWKRGMARVVFVNHAGVKQSEAAKVRKLTVVREILEDPKIKKGFQHGSYDVGKIRKLDGIEVRGYDHDTQYSEYLRFSNRKAYGLAAIADVRFREFAGYKEILEPWKDEKTGMADLWKVPPETLVIYNGADCDLTKRIEEDNDGKVDQELLQVFIKVAVTLAKMEENGPIFDWEHDKILQEWLPVRLELLRKQLQKISGKDKLNPNSPVQVAAVVYDQLKLGRYLEQRWRKEHGKRTTDKETMLLLTGHHKFPGLINEYRVLAKKKGTYMDGYRKSAQLHGGKLRTKWWLTGTVTGRLRSSGEKDKSKGLVNLQNIHGAEEIENLLVSDLRWREVYETWLRKR